MSGEKNRRSGAFSFAVVQGTAHGPSGDAGIDLEGLPVVDRSERHHPFVLEFCLPDRPPRDRLVLPVVGDLRIPRFHSHPRDLHVPAGPPVVDDDD